MYAGVDELYDAVRSSLDAFEVVAEIDHSRLAAEAGEVMPPARVVLFSDSRFNTRVLQEQPLAGLDLPFRVLAFAEGDALRVVATPAGYLSARHEGIGAQSLKAYDETLSAALAGLPPEAVLPFDTAAVGAGQGIVRLESIHSFEETVERLRTAILAEGDTIWFGDIDYRAEASALGVELPRLTLLLFGAPGPGAKAMADFPRMGLDAFCQKLLVLERPDGQVDAYYNAMPAMAEMHYGKSALPHKVINRRMGATLSGAVE